MLNALIKTEDFQTYISENEDSAFDYLKENFNVEEIYNYVVENINLFLNNESDLEECYEEIKAVARNHTLSIINESMSNDYHDGRWTEIWNNVKGFFFDGRMTLEDVSKLDSARKAAKALESKDPNAFNDIAQSVPVKQMPDGSQTSSEFLQSMITKMRSLGKWANDYINEVITPAIAENPKKAAAIAAAGFLGLAYIAVTKYKNRGMRK
jgi:hypothetical protein